jgi:putative polysaccharide biosynthesis protein
LNQPWIESRSVQALIEFLRERHPNVYSVLRKLRVRTEMQLSLSGLLRELRAADVPLPALLAGWLQTRLGPGRISLSEYCIFNLYRPSLSAQERKAFVGQRGQAILIDILADDYSMILNLDKLTFDHVARSAGLPVPAMFAVYAPQQRPGAFHKLTNVEELRDFLRGWRRFPIYCKPSCGGSGTYNFQIEGWADERAIVDGDRAVSVEELAARLTEPTGFGFLLMEALRQHDDMVAVAGDSISGIRIHVLRLRDGPTIFRPLWKIARQGAVVDNHRGGASGNLVASIDASTGRVGRVVSGIGHRQLVDVPHPDTGQQLTGFQLPHWQALREMVRGAAELFPGFLCQAWDVAICPGGPVVLEVNWFGGLRMPQHAYGRGFLEGEFLDLLRERNLEPLLRGRNARSRALANDRFGRRKAHWPY